MNRTMLEVVFPGMKLQYEYDFGTTTQLDLAVQQAYSIIPSEKITLLSRNEPLEILCELCKKRPAAYFCPYHDYSDESLFCDKCADKHEKECEDFSEEERFPVVNSPRMGQCGYTGGVIDKERDGHFKG